jgi:hypothetical protein
MPRQESVRGYESGDASKSFSTDGLGVDRQAAALIITQARAFSQLLLEHAYLLPEVFDDSLLVAIHPAGNAHQLEGERIHGEIILQRARAASVSSETTPHVCLPSARILTHWGSIEFSDSTGHLQIVLVHRLALLDKF